MKKFFENFIPVFLIFMCLYSFYYKVNNRKVMPVSVYCDTVRIVDTVFSPAPPALVIRVPTPIPSVVDTQAVIDDYFSKKVYADTLVSDENLSIAVVDTVVNNSIVGRKVEYSLSVPIPEPVTVYKPPDNEVYLSSVVGFYSTSVMVNYSRKSISYGIGYDFYNNSPVIGVAIKLARW